MKTSNNSPNTEPFCASVNTPNVSMTLHDAKFKIESLTTPSGWQNMVSDFRPYRQGRPANRLAIVRWILYLDTLIKTAQQHNWINDENTPVIFDALVSYSKSAIAELLERTLKHGSNSNLVEFELLTALNVLEADSIVIDAIKLSLSKKGDSHA